MTVYKRKKREFGKKKKTIKKSKDKRSHKKCLFAPLDFEILGNILSC